MKTQLSQFARFTLAVAFLMVFSVAASVAQTITGTVTGGEQEEPLIGVNVQVKGTDVGTVTDIDGTYSLTLPASLDQDNMFLVFSYVGYQAIEEPINGRTNIDVSMSDDFAELDEVVVIGYGTQKKADVTASIASVGEEEISEIPTSSTVNALQGRVAGLDIQSTGGRPGQFGSVRIRGRRSINASNDPLYVVDGIPLTDAAIAFDVNPNDILSVEVLKDAAATAIYGSRGANGVIIITTKRGTTTRTSVTYDGYYGISTPITKVDMMTGAEFANMKRESRRLDPATGLAAWNGIIPDDSQVLEDDAEFASVSPTSDALAGQDEFTTIEDGVRTTDYQDAVLENGSQQSHQIGIRGGNQNTQFFISLNYFNEQGVIPTQDFTRFSIRINADQRVNDFLKVGTSTYLARSVQNWASNPIGEALANNPLGVPFDSEGNLLFLPINDGIRTNPLSEIVPNAYVDERVFHNILPSFYAEFNLADGLTFKSTFGPDIRIRRQGIFQASETNARRGAPPRAQKNESTSFGYVLENLLTYNKQVGNGNLGVSLLQSIQENESESTFLQVTGLPFSSQLFNNLGTAEEVTGFDSGFSEWQLASFMGRVSYDLDGKYLIQASLRADGSSRLSPGNKWAYFPGVSVGWRLGEEDFLRDIQAITDLKLRVSYGEVGNTSINPFQTQGALGRTTYVFGDEGAFGYGLSQIPNPDLTWERTATLNFGLDFAFFNGRLSGTVDYYIANTTDLLLRRQLPRTSGYADVLENVGETENRGIELGLSTVNIDRPNFAWSTDLNVFSNTEEIISLFGNEGVNIIDGEEVIGDIGNLWFIGQPIGVFFDFDKVGIWQANEVDEAAKFGFVPGEIKLRDVNNDGTINADDRIIVGSDIPDVQFGITNRFDIGNFDFSFFIFSRLGHTIQSNFHTGNNTLAARYNNLDVDYWTPNNPTNAFPRPNLNQERPRFGSTLSYFDGSYVKLRNVTLGYNFPSSVTENLRMSKLRAYVQAQNPWFWSTFEIYDPETGQDDENGNNVNRQQGVSGDVPIPAIFLFGINVGF